MVEINYHFFPKNFFHFPFFSQDNLGKYFLKRKNFPILDVLGVKEEV